MQTVTLSEFCRIVKKVSEKEHKGKLSLAYMGENHGTCEDTGKQHGGIPRYKGEKTNENDKNVTGKTKTVIHPLYGADCGYGITYNRM